jgi:DNA-binding LacI/PurR family transcriptional regulator
MNGQRKVTIRDVAAAAGVSTTTVSDSLTGRGRLPEATRVRVARIADELGYVANPGAQNLRRGRTGTIALYFPQRVFGMQYYMDLAIGAAEEALAHDLALTLVPASHGRLGAVRLHIDGAVVADPMLGDPMLQHLSKLPIPLVTCERDLTPGAQHAGRIESDHRTAMRSLLDHLRHQGARAVALVCPREETSFAHDLRRTYLDWCRDQDQAPRVSDVPFASQREDITNAVQELLRDGAAVDAIVSVPDGGATSAMQAAQQAGRRIPDDLLIASYVDSPELHGLLVPVTAVDLSPREMGRQAARLLADLFEQKAEPGTVRTLPTKFQIRASTSSGLARTTLRI